MKERIGIHYGISFIYLVIIRNLLGQGYLYTNYSSAFQKSLIYCLVLSACLTILLEAWQMFKEVYIHRFKIQTHKKTPSFHRDGGVNDGESCNMYFNVFPSAL